MPVSLGISSIPAIINLIQGFSEKHKANQMAKGQVFPNYKISQEIYDNENLAESRAQRGFSEKTLAYLQNQLDRGLTSSNTAILQGGGGINAINSVYDNYVNSNKLIALEDEKLQASNINTLLESRLNVASEKATAYNINELSRYNNKQMAIAQMRTNANQLLSQAGTSFANIGLAAINAYGGDNIDKIQKKAVQENTLFDKYMAQYNANINNLDNPNNLSSLITN